MSESERCGAWDRRSGRPCERAPEPGRRRCRRHGGAPGSGGAKGNRNRHVHGYYSAAEQAERRAARELLSQGWALLRELDGEGE